jgi:hypothetical protein
MIFWIGQSYTGNLRGVGAGKKGVAKLCFTPTGKISEKA